MKHLFLAAGFCLAAAPTFAFHCPADMAKIDAALAAGTSLGAADLDAVKAWRAEGEAQHKAGDHAGSVKTLAKAMKKLGID